LNELLQSVSERQRLQQESRVKQQFERNATLTTGNNNDFPLLFQRDGNVDEEEEEEEEDNLLLAGRQELTQEQIQQFEQEESLLLQSTRQDLQSLQQAETSLLEISSLQTQLALHLNQQSELTDQLWSEAIEVSGRVNDANSQLKKAKERGKDSRISLLVFLIASSFTLLFLDYYSS
jgi:syntaxin 18